MDDDMMNPIERMRRVAEEFGASREAMDLYNAGPLADFEIIVGVTHGDSLYCQPCARETLGDVKVDWFLAQRAHDAEDENGEEFGAWVWEPFDPIANCGRCGRPLKPGEPADRGAPVGVTQWSDGHHVYCAEHADALLGPELAAQIFAPEYAGLAHVRSKHGEDVLIEFANGGETWKLTCEVCGERLAPEPEDDEEQDDEVGED